MDRTKKFFFNSVTTALYKIILMLAGLITPRLMLKFYGSEINGLVSSLNQFINCFALVEAGLAGAAIYALYKPLADNNFKAINSIVVATKKFYTKSGYLFVSLTIGLALVYPLIVKSNAITPFNIGLLVLILGVNGALKFFTLAKYKVLLSADQKTYIISMALIVETIVNTVIIIILAYLQVNIVFLRFVALISIFLSYFVLMFYVKTKYKFIDYKEEANFEALNKRWDALYLQISETVRTAAPLIILTLITRDLKLISVYTIFNMVMNGLVGILSIFLTGLPASFGDVIARNEEATLKKAYQEFEIFYYSLITTVYSIAFITIMPFIRIYTNEIIDVNYDIPLIGFLFVLKGLLDSIKTPQGMLIISAGLFKETKLQVTIQGAIAVLVGIVLTPFLGIAGVLIGSILSSIYRDIDLMFFIPKNVTKLKVKNTAYRIIRMFICIIIICIPFNFIKIDPLGYTTWVIYAIIVGMYALSVVVIMGLIFDKRDLINFAKRIFKVIKK